MRIYKWWQPFLLPALLCLLTACSKDGNDIPSSGNVDYEYDGRQFHYKVHDGSCAIRKISVYYSDTPRYYYTVNFPFSSTKTTDGLQLSLYNNILYAGQQFRTGTWSRPYEEYGQTFFTSNDLQGMVATHAFTPFDNWYTSLRSFSCSIDHIANGRASGRFSGQLVCYSYTGSNPTQYTGTDTITIVQGTFDNIQVLD
jgi:hypothetical protein